MLNFLKKNIKNDITAINPLITVCKFIGILPNINLNDMKEFKTYNFIPVVITVVFICLFFITIFGKITYLYDSVGITVRITDLSVDFSFALINIASFMGLNLWKGNRVYKFLLKLQKLDEQFCFVKSDSKYPNIKFCIEFALVHMFSLLHFIMNFTLWFNSMSFYVYQHFLLRDIQHYYLFVEVMLMRNLALLISYRYEILNKILSNLNITEHKVGRSPENVVSTQWCIRKVNEIFGNLDEIFADYNGIFGWQYFLMYIHVLANLLLPIYMCFVYGDGKNHIDGVHFGTQFVIFCLIWTILSVLLSLVIFSAGWSVSEARRTSTIAYKLLRELPNNEKFYYVRNELSELAQLASNNCPKITAAGFFTVNYKTLFSLYGSVASYVIVLMQYNK